MATIGGAHFRGSLKPRSTTQPGLKPVYPGISTLGLPRQQMFNRLRRKSRGGQRTPDVFDRRPSRNILAAILCGRAERGPAGEEMTKLAQTRNAGHGPLGSVTFSNRAIFLPDGTVSSVPGRQRPPILDRFALGVTLFWSVFAAAQLAARRRAPTYAISPGWASGRLDEADVTAIKQVAQRAIA